HELAGKPIAATQIEGAGTSLHHGAAGTRLPPSSAENHLKQAGGGSLRLRRSGILGGWTRLGGGLIVNNPSREIFRQRLRRRAPPGLPDEGRLARAGIGRDQHALESRPFPLQMAQSTCQRGSRFARGTQRNEGMQFLER